MVVSVDTFRADVARMCVEEYGADIINDISGGTMDHQMFRTVARLGVPYILMHMQGTPQTIAEDYVDRMMQREAEKAPDPEPEEPTLEAHERNIQAEAQELIVARPDLKTRQLPMEVVEAWRNGENLLNAYNRYEARQKEAENQKLKKENNILKQNAAAAAKAPVKGVTGGAPTDTEPEDPFLKGFDSDPW